MLPKRMIVDFLLKLKSAVQKYIQKVTGRRSRENTRNAPIDPNVALQGALGSESHSPMKAVRLPPEIWDLIIDLLYHWELFDALIACTLCMQAILRQKLAMDRQSHACTTSRRHY